MHSNHWKTEITDLRTRARAVLDEPTDNLRLSARGAARCLSGVMSLVARQWSVDVMQRACAELARYEAAWSTRFGTLPREGGVVPAPIEMIAVVARGILPISGEESMRAALAFWATENDPAAWQTVTSDRAA